MNIGLIGKHTSADDRTRASSIPEWSILTTRPQRHLVQLKKGETHEPNSTKKQQDVLSHINENKETLGKQTEQAQRKQE